MFFGFVFVHFTMLMSILSHSACLNDDGSSNGNGSKHTAMAMTTTTETVAATAGLET
jgi:hypothetical protein